jgi:hypothetical protein
LDDDMVEHVRFGIGGIDMGGIHVARDDREQVDVALRYGVRQAGRLAEGQLALIRSPPGPTYCTTAPAAPAAC